MKKAVSIIIGAFFVVVVTPAIVFASPLNIVGFIPNTVNVFHDVFVNPLANMFLDTTASNTYDPMSGDINFVVNLRDINDNLIGTATATGNLSGDNFNSNSGQLAGYIDFAFNFSAPNALQTFLEGRGACGNLVGFCQDRHFYADQYYYIASNGQPVNSWMNGDLRLWGGSPRTYLGSDLHIQTQPAIPEPGTLALLGSGVFGLVGYRRKRS